MPNIFQNIQGLSGEEAKELLSALAMNYVTIASTDHCSVRDVVGDVADTLRSQRGIDAQNINTGTAATGIPPNDDRWIRWCVHCNKSYCKATMIPGDCKYHSGKTGSLFLQ